MSTIVRTLRNLRRIGIKQYWHQLNYIGDTKAGTFIAQDRYGNKYYENLLEELPCMLRYLSSFLIVCEDALIRPGQRAWELTEQRPNATMSRSAYKPYST